MSSNRLLYDTETSKKNITQNTAPLSYLLNSSFKINRKNINNSHDRNCINKNINNNNKLNLYNSTRLINDTDDIDYQIKQSKSPGKYITSNYHSCTCKAEDISKVAFSQPNIYFRDGYGWTSNKGCNIDSDSLLRNGSLITNPGTNKRQLFTRPYLSVPYKGNGKSNCSKEVKVIKRNNKLKKKKEYENKKKSDNFIPLVPSLKKNIQNVSHILSEDAQSGWIRGGIPSRQTGKNNNYQKGCIQ